MKLASGRHSAPGDDGWPKPHEPSEPLPKWIVICRQMQPIDFLPPRPELSAPPGRHARSLLLDQRAHQRHLCNIHCRIENDLHGQQPLIAKGDHSQRFVSNGIWHIITVKKYFVSSILHVPPVVVTWACCAPNLRSTPCEACPKGAKQSEGSQRTATSPESPHLPLFVHRIAALMSVIC